MHPSTRVFISATTGDLGSARQLVKDALLAIGCHPIEQTNFPPDYRTVHEMLEDNISSCEAVIHIVGYRHGAEPDPKKIPSHTLRKSYTKMEYDLARKLKKKVYVFLCPQEFPYDPCEAEPVDKQRLQQKHRDELQADERIRTNVTTKEELAKKVRELQFELQDLRKQAYNHKRNIWIGIMLLLVVLMGIGYGIYKQTTQLSETRKLYENPEQIAQKMRTYIENKAEEELKAARDRGASWKEIRELERRRDLVLNTVEEQIHVIKRGLASEPDETFLEASRILGKEGVEAALNYLASHRGNILTRVDKWTTHEEESRRKKHNALQPLLLQAKLHEMNLAWPNAEALYKTAVTKAPEWFRTRWELGNLLFTLARFDEAESHLQVAHRHAQDDYEKALAASSLGIVYLMSANWPVAEQMLRQGNDLLKTDLGPHDPRMVPNLSNLGSLLYQLDRFKEAEEVLRKALNISLKHYGTFPLGVASVLNNLANLLMTTNRTEEATSLYRKLVAIIETFLGPSHPKASIALNNLAALLRDSNHPVEADLLLRRALAISEVAYGRPDHPEITVILNNLSILLQKTNRFTEAEPLLLRALALDATSNGEEHPTVIRDLINLSELLRRTKRLTEAESLLRRVLILAETVYGPDHTHVSSILNNLGLVFLHTKREKMAELLLRRSLNLTESIYGPAHPNVADTLENLGNLLLITRRSAEHYLVMSRRAAINNEPFDQISLEHYTQLLTEREYSLDILKALAAQYENKEKRRVWIQSLDLPISPHLDEILGPTMVKVPLNQPVAPRLNKLLGPIESMQVVLDRLERKIREENKPMAWFPPHNEPLTPHIDELLGPPKINITLNEPISPQLDEWFGPIDEEWLKKRETDQTRPDQTRLD